MTNTDRTRSSVATAAGHAQTQHSANPPGETRRGSASSMRTATRGAIAALLLVSLASCAARPVRPQDDGETVARAVLEFRWERRIAPGNGPAYNPEELAVPIVDRERRRVYVGSAQGGLYAMRLSNGGFIYKVETRGPVRATPVLVPHLSRVFFGSDDGALYSIEADDGAVAWRYQTRGTVRTAPVYDGGVVFFTTGEDRLYAIEARSGRWRWHYERELPEGFTIRGQSGAAVLGSRVYAGFSDGYVVALDVRSGDVLWSTNVGKGGAYADADGTPVLAPDGKTVYVSAYAGGVYALDGESGSVRWHYPVEGPTRVTVDEERLYFSAPTEGVHALDHQGRLIWRQAVKQGTLSAPVPAADRYVILGASEAGLYIAARENGRLLGFFKAGAGISSEPTVDGGSLYFVSNTGFLYSAILQ